MKMKLNGWQRIWVVLATLTLLPTLFLATESMQTEAYLDKLFADRMIDHTLELKKNKNITWWQIRDAYKDLSDKELYERALSTYEKEMDEAGINYRTTAEEYEKRMKSLWRVQFTNIAQYIGLWASALIVIYVLGWSVGWIAQGFRRSV
jgi:hypothetical protein